MAQADPNIQDETESPWYQSLGPSQGMINRVQHGDIDLAAIAEEIAKRSPVAASAKFVANQPFLRSFANSAAAKTVEPIAAGLSALAEKPLQWAGRVPDRSVGAAYKHYRGEQQDVQDEQKAEHGGQTLLGDIAGVVAPGGVFNRAFAVTNKATAPIAAAGEKMMEKGAPALSKIGGWLTKYAVRPVLRGGSAQVATEAVNPESNIYKDPKYLATAAAMGAVGDAGGEIGMQGLKGLGTVGKGILNYGVAGLKGIPGVGDVIEEFSKKRAGKAVEAFKEGASKLGKQVGADDVLTAGEGFQEGTGAVNDAMFKEYKAIRDPVMKKFSGDTASVKNLREHIAGALDDAGVLDAKGSIDFNSPIFHGPDAADYKLLARYSESLNSNPTMKELDNLIKGFGNRANFGASERTPMQRIYGKLYGGGRDDLLDSAEALVTNVHKSGKQYNQAQKEFSTALDEKAAATEARKNLEGVAEQQGPFNLPSGITNKTGADIQTAADAERALAERVGQTHETVKGMDQAAEDTGELTAELIRQGRQKFSAGRRVMEPLNKIADKTPEQIVAGASSKGKSGLPGSVILNTIKEVPEMKPHIAKAVMGNILSKAKDPKSMSKAIDNFGRDAMTELFGPEVMSALAHLEGTTTKSLGDKASGLYQRAHNWAVRNPQVARPGLFVPRVMLNEAQQQDQGEEP